ncbi:MAG: hydrogenase maturation protein HypF [Solirubrobacteraceae bacterium]|nr:hydrogenase maturation protein HypF [Solirubrobacteraceae bacterium]
MRARVEGTVQGVGFRPYVHRLASELGVSGHVFNDSRGVVVEAEADGAAVQRFLDRLPAEAPPLATVERVLTEELPFAGDAEFAIVESPRGGEPSAPVSPDSATCADCLAELFDSVDRRYRYPFVNCTNCGPRFTIVRGVPYDRPFTTMAGFEMCPGCRAEYDDPTDRRFHAQPNACPECGPRTWLADTDGVPVERGGARDAVQAAAQALLAGSIVAIKGLGGFHLACLASDEVAVAALRGRKHREDKPFALMAPSLVAARELVEPRAEDEELLVSIERPIVLATRRGDADVAPAVAPLSPELGVMLPYSPLHHLLLSDVGATLVMTSGNVSDEPIAYGDADALARLEGIADLFLLHDRPIQTRTDDSVLRTFATNGTRRTQMLRRSRGFVPASLTLPVATARHVLACGAELKNTFCVAKGERAWVGHHVGDLQNYETLRSFTEGVEHFRTLFAVKPEVVAHDLHPEYLSSKYAHELDAVELVGVQHHHAHLAACLAEHGETGPAVAAVYDGTGYGYDGTIWGGELLVGDLLDFERAGLLNPVQMPGGEAAIRQPWRMACAWLAAAFDEPQSLPPALSGVVEEVAWRQVGELVRTGLASPLTTSVGRLFDAVAALCGVRAQVNYEGQAAVELEAACAAGEEGVYPLDVVENGGQMMLDARPTVRALVEDLAGGASVGVVAARFHNTMAAATASACAAAAEGEALDTVVLSGGVFQNRRLLERTFGLLADAGLHVLTPERLPPNDGGIAFGQAAVAAAHLAALDGEDR